MSDSKQNAVEEHNTWRANREKNLRKDDSWLSFCGLWWPNDGPNSFGSSSECQLRLPSKVAAKAGVLDLAENKFVLHPVDDVPLTMNGAPVTGPTELKSDAGGVAPSVVTLPGGEVSLSVLKRDGKTVVRAKDKTNPNLLNFKGLTCFPYDPSWVIAAKYKAHTEPKTMVLNTAMGIKKTQTSTGFIEFERDGATLTLDVIPEDASSYWLMFKDKTNGKDTYGMRYLYTPKEDAQGIVYIDFNRAFSPPCAYTEFATCPMPPKQNWLPIRVEAGEKYVYDDSA